MERDEMNGRIIRRIKRIVFQTAYSKANREPSTLIIMLSQQGAFMSLKA